MHQKVTLVTFVFAPFPPKVTVEHLTISPFLREPVIFCIVVTFLH